MRNAQEYNQWYGDKQLQSHLRRCSQCGHQRERGGQDDENRTVLIGRLVMVFGHEFSTGVRRAASLRNGSVGIADATDR